MPPSQNNPYITKSINKYSSAQQNDSNLRKGILMYAQLIAKLELARSAMISDDRQSLKDHIKASEEVIMKLKLSLDTESQDEIVLIFDQLYNSIIHSLHGIIILNKPVEDLEDIIVDVRRLKEEFEKVDQREGESSSFGQSGSKHIEC